MITLRFMGEGEPEAFRCRVYGVDEEHGRRRQFIVRLATCGVLDAPAWDPWTSALQERGWAEMTLEPNPDGPGRVGRWRLTDAGRVALADEIGGAQ